MISRRAAIGFSTSIGVAALAAAPARACRVLRPESRTSSMMQIDDVAAQISLGSATGAIVASDRVRISISDFVSTTVARRDAINAKQIETVVSTLYEAGDDIVFLVNFLLRDAKMLVLSCGDAYRNNHAMLSFRAGRMHDFQPMTIFNSEERVQFTS